MVPSVRLPEDPEAAAKHYLRVRLCVRETFENFLRDLGSQSLRWLEQQFERAGGELDSASFLRVFSRVFPKPSLGSAADLAPEEREFAVHLAVKLLFEGMDVDRSGGASWMEFVEFVCAIAEELRLQAQELSGQSFDFRPSQVSVPYRPQAPKCHFDRAFYWPEHPLESAVIFEEGQPGFHLHRPSTMARKRRVDGHTNELLAAAYLPSPFQWVVTSGNDSTLCFWDETFKLVKKCKSKHVIGELCWCHEVKVLYAAKASLYDQATEAIEGWRITSPLIIRDPESALRPEKALEFRSGHTAPVQCMIWLGPLQTLATASMDSSVRLFDFVQFERTHVLLGHRKAVTSLAYCQKSQMLLSSGFDNFINIWDPSAGILSHTLNGHECSIAGICAVPGTDYEFMSVDFEGIVRLWDVRRLVLVQTFSATDRQAEQVGDIEPLEARTVCALGRDRVLVGGRRLVVFDRDASDPRLTADYPISGLAFNHSRIEVVTPVKNDLYLWCALTGTLLSIHDNVTDGNISAVTLGIGERRIFIGADDGQISAINYACGALLKRLSPHACEVSQIECLQGKVLSVSSAEKLVLIHDDGDPKRSVVLKRIDLSSAGAPILQIAHDGRETIAGGSEEGDVFWYRMDFAKQVSSSERCEVQHRGAVTCCRYFKDAPLIVTADSEGCCIFWSLRPLRTYDFFSKAELDARQGCTALALSWPEEERLFVGTERGSLLCVSIAEVVARARRQREEILLRKERGESADVISGRIFDRMPKPRDSPEYVTRPTSEWIVEAHRGQLEQILPCERRPSVLLTLGTDACVRLWSEQGEALGALEQGLPEGLSYERESCWRLPLDAGEQVREDLRGLERAAQGEPGPEPERPAERPPERSPERPRERALERPHERPQERPRDRPQDRLHERPRPRLGRQEAAATLRPVRGPKGPSKPKRTFSAPELSAWPSPSAEWLAGPLSPGQLPRLASGLQRPPVSQSKAVVEAARRLSSVLQGQSCKDLL